MKKWLGVLLTLALCLGAACGALADWTLTEIGTLSDAAWIGNSNLLRVQTKDGYRVCDIAGNVLTDDAYGSSFSYEYGYVVATDVSGGLNATGVFDRTGTVLLPYQYGDVDILSADWAVGFKLKEATGDNYDYTSWGDSSKFYLIDTVDVYNLKSGACVATLNRSDYNDADVVGDVLNIENRTTGEVTSYDADFNALGTVKYTFDDDYATFELNKYRENGQYGLKDAAGNIVMAPSFYTIYDFYGDYAVVSTGEKEGLIDRQGNVVIPAEYDDIKRSYYSPYDPATDTAGYNAAGYFAVIKDGKLGFVNEQGVLTCEPKYSEKIMELYGASAKYTDMENNTHLLAADGVDTVIDDYENIYCLDGSSGLLYRVTNADYDYGVIDWHGNVIFECAYDHISLSGDGRYLLTRMDYKSPYVLYEIAYVNAAADAQAAPAAEPAQTGAVPAAQSASDARAVMSSLLGRSTQTAAETGQPSGETEQESGTVTQSGLTDAKAIVSTVITLLEADAAANKLTAVVLLDDVLALSGDTSVQTIITSVKALIEADAAANAATAVMMLHSVETLL